MFIDYTFLEKRKYIILQIFVIGSEIMEEPGHHGLAVLQQRVVAAGQAPVVDQSPFAQGVDAHHLVGGHIAAQFVPLLALENDLTQEAVIDPIMVQQVLVSPGN